MAEKKDYAEVMLEAVDTVVKKRIEAVSFDKTIDAVIVDDVNGANGVYQVSADGATFTAYSTSTEYKKNDSVMVTIPQGNYDNQKIIIGKKVTKQADSMMIYKSPFSAIADLTGNLIHSNINGYTTGIYANYTPDTQVWENIDLALTGYTRLGFVGEFSTWLQEYGTVSGTYGVKIILTIKNPDNSDSTYEKTLSFTSDEFFGNVYSFYSYTSQEIVFDISDYANEIITKIQLKIFQNNDFYDKNGQRIPTPPPEDDEDNVFSLIPPNIYLKDPYICCGVDANTFTNDSCLLVTNSSTSYHKKMASGESEESRESEAARDDANKKIITLRWIHKDDVSGLIHIIDQGSVPTDYEIQWYRYNLEAANDGLMGAHWERLKYQYQDENENKQKNAFSTLTTGYADFDNDEDKAWFIANKGLKINFYPRVNNPNERLIAMVVRNGTKVAQSPELVFTNDDEVRNIATYVDDNALAIKATDGTGGQYAGYNRANNLIQASEATVIRTLQAVFDDSEHPADIYNRSDLSNCTDIIWYFPRNRSMITLVDADGNTLNEKNAEKIDIDETDSNYYKIEYQRDPYEDVDDTAYYQLHYCIKKSFSNYYNNNIVRLEVKKDGQWYQAQIELRFLGAGTSGSDYTILLDHPGVNSYFTKLNDNGTFNRIQCTLFVQNSDFTLAKLPPEARYNFEWLNNNKDITTVQLFENAIGGNPINLAETNIIQNNIATFYLAPIDECDMDTFHILKVTLSNFQEYDLTAYFTIPSRQNYEGDIIADNITKITLVGANAPEEVRYTTDGEIDFYGNPSTIDATITRIINEEPKTQLVHHDGIHFIFLTNVGVALNNEISEQWSLSPWSYLISQDTKPRYKKNYYELLQNGQYVIYSDLNEHTNPATLGLYEKAYFTFSLREGIQHYDDNDNKDGGDNNQYNAPILNPPGVYFKEDITYGLQFKIKRQETLIAAWTQPIYVYQDNYPSTTLNKWNGKDIQLNEDEGTIVANGFAAGKKESDNTFTGVVLGDWSRSDTDPSLTKRTGVYGMHHGAMAYAIKDDGTMFLGKDGHGRIEFNGNTGTIKSSTWDLPTDAFGTLFDLDDGILDVKGGNQNETLIKPGELYIKAAQTSNNLTTQKTLMEVTSSQYYLQSYDFNSASGHEAGVKFDLKAGKLTGYKFDLLAGTGNNQIKLTSSTEGNAVPLQIGDIAHYKPQFKVSWEGDVFANGGNIAGWYFKKPPGTSEDYGAQCYELTTDTEVVSGKKYYIYRGGQYNEVPNVASGINPSELQYYELTDLLSEYYGLFSSGFNANYQIDYYTAMQSAKIQLHPRFGLRMWNPSYGSDSFNGVIVLDPTKIGGETQTGYISGHPNHKEWPLSIAYYDQDTEEYPTPFAVDWNGTLYSTKGTIGGWTIDENQLSSTARNGGTVKTIKLLSGTNPGLQILKDDQSVFAVADDGTVTAGGWTIDETSIKKGNVTLSSDNTKTNDVYNHKPLTIGANFDVSWDGALTAKSGTIGDWKITASTLQNESGTISLSSTGATTLKITNKFKVTNAGKVTAQDLEITGGSISIKDSNNNEVFGVTSAGALNATSGTIGGWTINTSSNTSSLSATNQGQTVGLYASGGPGPYIQVGRLKDNSGDWYIPLDITIATGTMQKTNYTFYNDIGGTKITVVTSVNFDTQEYTTEEVWVNAYLTGRTIIGIPTALHTRQIKYFGQAGTASDDNTT